MDYHNGVVNSEANKVAGTRQVREVTSVSRATLTSQRGTTLIMDRWFGGHRS
jgi:hypothetical protein